MNNLINILFFSFIILTIAAGACFILSAVLASPVLLVTCFALFVLELFLGLIISCL